MEISEEKKDQLMMSATDTGMNEALPYMEDHLLYNPLSSKSTDSNVNHIKRNTLIKHVDQCLSKQLGTLPESG